jgi:hypothetical protein
LDGLTRKELIEGGWIDKYILGLTTDAENHEVERLATIYPDVQEEINKTRGRLCGKFNRSLTQPAMRHRFVTKRRILYGSGVVILLLCAGLVYLWKAHFSLKQDYEAQQEQLKADEAKLSQFAALNRMAADNSAFLHKEDTRRIRLAGCGATPDSEVMIFQCEESGKMKLRVIELPDLKQGHYFEVMTNQGDTLNAMLGRIYAPVRYDSLYVLNTSLHSEGLQINMVDPVAQSTTPVCLSAVPD